MARSWVWGAWVAAAIVAAAVGCEGNRPLREARQRAAGGAAGGAPPLPGGGAAAGAYASASPGGGGAGEAAPPSSDGAAGSVAPPPSTGAAGSGEPAPDDGFAGTGVVPPPPAFCDSQPKKPLPYAIASDFSSPFLLNATFTWMVEPGADCNQTVFPDVAGPDAGAGDGGVSDGGWSASPGAGGGGAPASCWVFRYDPDDCLTSLPPQQPDGAAADPVAACWAGVILSPSGFGGPGVCIAPGATAIHFKARASRDGARVKFGSIRAGLGSTEFFIPLTTAWVDYTVSIPPGEDYDDENPFGGGGVFNGFSVVAEPEDHAGGTYIFVSDVVWAAQ